jgi:hypothetical protein
VKIELRKISKTPSEFEVKSDKITFKGFLQYDSSRLILLRSKLIGEISTTCDICTSEFELNLDEDIEFFISLGLYKSSSDEFLEVVEIFDSFVDVEDLLKMELESIKSDYHLCTKCADKDEEFEYILE